MDQPAYSYAARDRPRHRQHHLHLDSRRQTAEGLHFHIPKGYVYFAMAFSFGVEMLNLRLRRKTTPVELHERYR